MKCRAALGRYLSLANRMSHGDLSTGATPPRPTVLPPLRRTVPPTRTPARHYRREPRRRPPMIEEDVMVSSAEADQLRQQLLQAQKLSSVGALASSVAHEFNNILTTIINYAKLGLRPGHDEKSRTEALEKILKG